MTVVEDEQGRTSMDARSGGASVGNVTVGRLVEGQEHDDETEELRRRGRECPVPKPAGMVGRMLGFRREEQRVVPGVHIVGGDDVRIDSGKEDKEGG